MSKLSALQQLVISIHALREESDVVDAAHLVAVIISIHALREESDHILYPHGANKCTFQSTLSVRRATGTCTRMYAIRAISIHALREESDYSYARWAVSLLLFQSTLSVRRATLASRSLLCASNFNPRSP